MFVEDSFVSVDHSYCSLLVLSSCVDNVCVYINGFVVRRLLPRLKCSDCCSLLVDVKKRSAPDTCFLELKDRGGLVCPSRGVVRIVQTAEKKNFRTLVPRDKPIHAISRLGQWLENAVLSDIDCSTVFGMSDHFADSAVLSKIKSNWFGLSGTKRPCRLFFSYFALDLQKISHINALMSKIKNNEDMACFGRETDNCLKSVGGKCK